MMKYIGTIIVHRILQGGSGFPVFSHSVYQYLATGDVDAAMMTLNYGVCSAPVKDFIDKVAQAKDVSTLDQEECANFLSDCGLAVVLTFHHVFYFKYQKRQLQEILVCGLLLKAMRLLRLLQLQMAIAMD